MCKNLLTNHRTWVQIDLRANFKEHLFNVNCCEQKRRKHESKEKFSLSQFFVKTFWRKFRFSQSRNGKNVQFWKQQSVLDYQLLVKNSVVIAFLSTFYNIDFWHDRFRRSFYILYPTVKARAREVTQIVPFEVSICWQTLVGIRNGFYF